MYGIRSLQNGGAPKKLGKAEKYIPPELRPQAGALVDLIKWIRSNPFRAALNVAESVGPQADIKGITDSSQSAMRNFLQGNIGAGLLDTLYIPANLATLVFPGSASGYRKAGEAAADQVLGLMDDIDPSMPRRLVNPEMRVFQGGPNKYGPDVPGTKAGLDSSKIGTGEGAQVYGHGHYLAQRRGIAEYYRDALAEGDLLFRKDGTPIPTDSGGAITPAGTFSSFARGYGNLDDAARGLKEQVAAIDDGSSVVFRITNPPSPERVKEIRDGYESALEWYAKNRDDLMIERRPGHLYEYDLPDEVVDRMLDWDKPLSEQPQAVKDALDEWNPLAKNAKNPDFELHQMIRSKSGSKMLRERGIPGIKYLDQGSRGAGNNLVIDGVPMSNRGFPMSDSAAEKVVEAGSPQKALELPNLRADERELIEDWAESDWEIDPGTRNFVLFDDDAAKLLARDGVRFDKAALPMDEASERAQEAIRGQADPIEQAAKESYAANNPDKAPAK